MSGANGNGTGVVAASRGVAAGAALDGRGIVSSGVSIEDAHALARALGCGDDGLLELRRLMDAFLYRGKVVAKLSIEVDRLDSLTRSLERRCEELSRENDELRAAAAAKPATAGVVYGIWTDEAATARNNEKRATPQDLERWFLLGPYVDHVVLGDDEVREQCARHTAALAFAHDCGLCDYVPFRAAFARAYACTARREELRAMARDTSLAMKGELPEASTGAYHLGKKYRRFEVAEALGRPGTMGLLFGSALLAINHDVVVDPPQGGERKGLRRVGSSPMRLSLKAEDAEWLARARRAATQPGT